MSTVMTLDNIVTRVRERADMVNNNFVTDNEIESYVNQSYFELYDLLVQKYGENYFVTSRSFDTDGTSSQYPLAPPYASATYIDYSSGGGGVNTTSMYDIRLDQDFFKLLGVDLKLTPQSGQESWVTIRPFQFAERNRYAVPNMQSFYGLTNLRYRLHGDNLMLTPTPAAGQTLRYWFIPRVHELMAVATCTFKAGQFWQGGDNMYIEYDGQAYGIDLGVFVTGNIGAPVTPNIIDIPLFASQIIGYGGTGYMEGFVSSSYSNVDEYVAGTGDGYVYLHLNLTKNFKWDVNSNSRAILNPPRQTYVDGCTDGISGWTEYMIVDAAIKCMQKEESDASVLMAQKQGLIARIEAAAANRDAGNPAVVSDSQWSDFWLPMGQGGMGGGGGY